MRHHRFLSVVVTWEEPWLTLGKQKSWLPFSNARLRMCVWGGGGGVCKPARVCICMCRGFLVFVHMCMCGRGRPGTGEIWLLPAATMPSPALAACVVPVLSGAWLPGGKRLG